MDHSAIAARFEVGKCGAMSESPYYPPRQICEGRQTMFLVLKLPYNDE